MSEQALKWADRYGLPLLATVALAIVAYSLFGEIKAANEKIEKLVVEYHTTVIELGHSIETLLTAQNTRDQQADATREEANIDRERNRELLRLTLDRIAKFEDLWLRARELTNIRSQFVLYYLNKDAVRQGIEAPFPIEDLEKLEAKLKVMLEEAQQQ